MTEPSALSAACVLAGHPIPSSVTAATTGQGWVSCGCGAVQRPCDTSSGGSNSLATDAPSGTVRAANPDGAGRTGGAVQPAKKDQADSAPERDPVLLASLLAQSRADLAEARALIDVLKAELVKAKFDISKGRSR